MSRRRGEPVETPEFAGMVRRMIAAHGRRVADADPEDLADLVALRETLEEAIAHAVEGQRSRWGRSWAEVARGLGTTRQAAQMRYGRTVDSDATTVA